jgi:hypothetical protein
MPYTRHQIEAAANSIKRYGDIIAAVRLIGGKGKRSTDFLAQHETGGTRTPAKGEYIAIPGEGMPKHYRTRSGRVKQRYKPRNLLKQAKATGGLNRWFNNTTSAPVQRPYKRSPSRPFMMKKGETTRFA